MQTNLYKLLEDPHLTKLIKRLSLKTNNSEDIQKDLYFLHEKLKHFFTKTNTENLDTFIILISDSLKNSFKDKFVKNVELGIKILRLLITKNILDAKKYKEEENYELIELSKELKIYFLLSFLENIYNFEDKEIIKFGLNSLFNTSVDDLFLYLSKEPLLLLRGFKLFIKKLEKSKEINQKNKINDLKKYEEKKLEIRRLLVPYLSNIQSVKFDEEMFDILFLLNYFQIKDEKEIPLMIFQMSLSKELIKLKWEYLRKVGIFCDSFYADMSVLSDEVLISFTEKIDKKRVVLHNRKIFAIFMQVSNSEEIKYLIQNYINHANEKTEIFDIFEYSLDLKALETVNQEKLNIFLSFVIKNRSKSIERIKIFSNNLHKLSFLEKMERHKIFGLKMKSKVENEEFPVIYKNMGIATQVFKEKFFKKNLHKLEYHFMIFKHFPNLIRKNNLHKIDNLPEIMHLLKKREEKFIKYNAHDFKNKLKDMEIVPLRFYTMFYFLYGSKISKIDFYDEKKGNTVIFSPKINIFEALKYHANERYEWEKTLITENISKLYKFLSKLKLKKSLYFDHSYFKTSIEYLNDQITILPPNKKENKILKNFLTKFNFDLHEFSTFKKIVEIMNNKKYNCLDRIYIKKKSYENLKENKIFLFAAIFEIFDFQCKDWHNFQNKKDFENFKTEIFSEKMKNKTKNLIFNDFLESIIFEKSEANLQNDILMQHEFTEKEDKINALILMRKILQSENLIDFIPTNVFLLNNLFDKIEPSMRKKINPNLLSNSVIKNNSLSLQQFCKDQYIYAKQNIFLKKFHDERLLSYKKTIENLSVKIREEIRANYLFCETENQKSLEGGEAFNLMMGSFKELIENENILKFWRIFLESVFMQRSINLIFYLESQISKSSNLVFNYEEYLNFIISDKNKYEREIQLFAFIFKRLFNKKIEIDCSKLILEECQLINLNNVETQILRTTHNILLKIIYEIKNDSFEISLNIPKNISKSAKFSTKKENKKENKKSDFFDLKLDFLLKKTNKYSEILNLWKINMDNKLSGVLECSICFFIVSMTKEFPQHECIECHAKYHASCLNSWRIRQKSDTCALCRREKTVK